MVYLDYAAGTKPDREVLNLYNEISENVYANPNSNHDLGRKAKKLIAEKTEEILECLGLENHEIIYTSGATETNNLVIKGICKRYKNYGKHILVSSVEHTSIIKPATIMEEEGFEVELIPLKKDGLIDKEELKKMIRKDTILISITSLDGELGIRQPIEEIGELLKEYPHTYFHTDASQAIGKEEINYQNVDMITLAPHKFEGMNDIGLLIKKKEVMLTPLIDGGKSTTPYRSGTPNTAGIVSTAFALKKALLKRTEREEYVESLKKKLVDFLEKEPNIDINSTKQSSPYIINFSIKKQNANEVVEELNQKGIYVSAKTSCCPLNAPSKLVYALTKDKNRATSSIRISLSHKTTEREIETVMKELSNCLKEYEKNGKIPRN